MIVREAFVLPAYRPLVGRSHFGKGKIVRQTCGVPWNRSKNLILSRGDFMVTHTHTLIELFCMDLSFFACKLKKKKQIVKYVVVL